MPKKLKSKFLVREDLVESLIHTAELPRSEAMSVVEAIFGSIADSLRRGEAVYARGLGTFGLRRRKGRNGRNPRTGAHVRVPAKSIVYFKPGTKLKRLLVSPESEILADAKLTVGCLI